MSPDINECLTGDFVCHRNARCVNTIGSYRCDCNDGYVGDGQTCIPIGKLNMIYHGHLIEFRAKRIRFRVRVGVGVRVVRVKGYRFGIIS